MRNVTRKDRDEGERELNEERMLRRSSMARRSITSTRVRCIEIRKIYDEIAEKLHREKRARKKKRETDEY